jgi:hypothetical protein
MSNSAKLLKTHSATWLREKRPDLAYLMRFVTKGDDAADHWFWNTDPEASNPRRLSEHGQAVISWSPSTRFKRGIFSVARLLIEYLKEPIPERTVYEPLCDLARCVNPAHWKRRELPLRYRFDQTSEGWRVVECRTGRPVQRHLLLAVRDCTGTTHMVAVPPFLQQGYAAVCAEPVEPSVSMVLPDRTIITCKGCS